MARFMNPSGPRLEVRREQVEVTTNLPQPDPNWTYTDEHGHEHAYGSPADPYPTLVRRYGEPYWCEECQDEHQDTWLECPHCGERIEPGTFVDPTRKFLAGRTEYLLDGEPIAKEEGERLESEMRAQAEEEARAARARKLEPLAEAMRAEGIAPDVVERVLGRLEN